MHRTVSRSGQNTRGLSSQAKNRIQVLITWEQVPLLMLNISHSNSLVIPSRSFISTNKNILFPFKLPAWTEFLGSAFEPSRDLGACYFFGARPITHLPDFREQVTVQVIKSDLVWETCIQFNLRVIHAKPVHKIWFDINQWFLWSTFQLTDLDLAILHFFAQFYAVGTLGRLRKVGMITYYRLEIRGVLHWHIRKVGNLRLGRWRCHCRCPGCWWFACGLRGRKQVVSKMECEVWILGSWMPIYKMLGAYPGVPLGDPVFSICLLSVYQLGPFPSTLCIFFFLLGRGVVKMAVDTHIGRYHV